MPAVTRTHATFKFPAAGLARTLSSGPQPPDRARLAGLAAGRLLRVTVWALRMCARACFHEARDAPAPARARRPSPAENPGGGGMRHHGYRSVLVTTGPAESDRPIGGWAAWARSIPTGTRCGGPLSAGQAA
jgi:hypothetical protein